MRQQLSFTIPGQTKTFQVNELTVRQILALTQGGLIDKALRGELSELRDTVLPMASNLSVEEALDLTPGELRLVWEKLREVNAAFFDLARATGFLEVLKQTRDAAVASFSAWLSSFSRRDTAASLTTALDSSGAPTGSTCASGSSA